MTEKTQTATLIPSSLHEITRQLPTLKQSIILEESRAPRVSQGIILATIGLLLSIFGWSAVTPIQQTVTSHGEIIATDKIKIIQHLDGGIISSVHVQEGELVQEGQILMRLTPNAMQSELDALTTKEQILQIKADRLRAFGLNQNFDITQYPNTVFQLAQEQKAIYEMHVRNREDQRLTIMNQIEHRRAQLALTLSQEHDVRHQLEIAEQQRDVSKKLFEKKLGTGTDYRHAEENVSKLRNELSAFISQSQHTRQKISEEEGRLVELDTQLRNGALKEMESVTTELTAINEQKVRLKGRLDRLVLKAPIAGLIKGFNGMKVGEFLEPGKKMCQIVPLANIEATLNVRPRDASLLRIGQPVHLKVLSEGFQSSNALEGNVTSISNAVLMDANNQPFHKIIVTLSKNYLGTDPKQNLVLPGMNVAADIQVGEKTMLNYLIGPLSDKLAAIRQN